MTAERRPYQRRAIEALFAAYDRGVRRSLLVMPTGTGKTNVFVWAIGDWAERGGALPALVVAHREELIQQAAERVAQLLPDLRVGIEKGPSLAPRSADVVIASVQTIGRHTRGNDPRERVRLKHCDPGLVIIDEAHHSPAYTYKRVVARYADRPDTFVVGCTATPKRLDQLSLHKSEQGLFEEVSFEYSIQEAISEGWLCTLRGFQIHTDVNLDDVETIGGDFVESALAKKVKNATRTKAAVVRWLEIAPGRSTIAFGVDVEHSEQIAAAFRAVGVAAECIHGALRSEERAAAIGRFKSGETTVLCNCMLATEGFDAPATSCVLMLRPTQSWSLYVQMVGRGTRVLDGKRDCVILDVVDNTTEHDLVTLPAVIDLPATLDLEGHTLEEAAQAMDRVATLADFDPHSFTDLLSVVEEVDLFARIIVPELVKSATRLAWLQSRNGYMLGCGGEDVKREARLARDGMGGWHLRLTEEGWNPESQQRERTIIYQEPIGSNEDEALRDAERVVLWHWSDAGRVASHMARWRMDPITEGQVAFLRKLGLPDSVICTLDKGRASAMITLLKEKKGARRAA